jgi:thiamine pyrophosphokinase
LPATREPDPDNAGGGIAYQKQIPSATAEVFSLRAVIFANGELKGHEAVRDLLQPDDLILAADGGSSHCRALGLTPAALIGDLDSVTGDDLALWKEAGTQIIRHNPDKDENDLELALLHAKEKGMEEILILGGLGGRWDQTLANILLPAYGKLAGLSISFWDDGQWLYLVRDEKIIRGREGQTVSLIPIQGDAQGVTTQGLAWALNDETLYFGASRGVSNRMLKKEAVVSVRKGILLCIVSDEEESNQESGNQEVITPDP